MTKIYICEDDAIQLEKMKYLINKKIIADELAMDIALWTDNPESLLTEIEHNTSFSIYFLDIDLKDNHMNGLVLAQKIRGLDPDAYIIFVTTHAEMSFLTFQYKVSALDFIIKDQFEKVEEKISECLDAIAIRLNGKKK